MKNPLINKKVYATFNKRSSKCLPDQCLKVLSEQIKAWVDLREGCESLGNVRERSLTCRGFSVRLQHNPGRIKSSLARVSEKDGTERPCFLCLDHLPEGQKGILHRGEYLILCNPMPVFSSHFTVSHLDHRRQAIAENIDTFLQLIADFGSGWTILYNGPRSGASAPDHLHFQVVPSGQMPIEKDIQEEDRRALAKSLGGVPLYRLTDLGREVIVLEGTNPSAVVEAFGRFLNALREVLPTDEEPMMNVMGSHRERKWRLVIFPRRKHRPDAFFKDGEARMVISPGAIDMGGVLITPVESDFRRIDAGVVEGIYREVSLETEIVEEAIDTLR